MSHVRHCLHLHQNRSRGNEVIDSVIEICHRCCVVILKQNLSVVVGRVDHPLNVSVVIEPHLLSHGSVLHDAGVDDAAIRRVIGRASR